MKTIIIIIFSLIVLNCMAQKDLTLSRVIYIPLKSDKASNFVAKDTVITIPNGKIWEITNTKVAMIYDNRILADKTYLYLDEQILTYSHHQIVQKSDPLWLPPGKYRISIRTEDENQTEGRFIYIAFLSGIEYDL